MNRQTLGFLAFIIFFSVSFGQFHMILPGFKYLKLGLISSVILILLVLPNILNKDWLKPIGIWRIFFIISIIPGIFFGYGTGIVRKMLIAGIIDFFAGFIGVCTFVNNVHRLKKLNSLLLFVGFVFSIYAITHSGHGPGSLFDENDTGLILVMLLPFPYFSIIKSNTKNKNFIYTCLIGLIFIAVASTLSRGAMVGILPTLLIIWINSKKKLLTLALLICLIVLAVITAPPKLIGEFGSIKNTDQGTAASRIRYWNLSMEMFKEKPIFGVGAGCWGNAIWSGVAKTFNGTLKNMTPHSIYFQLISELGIFGVIAWSGLILVSFKTCFNVNKLIKRYKCHVTDNIQTNDLLFLDNFTKAISIGMFGGLICGIFLSFLFEPQLFLFCSFIQSVFLVTLKKISDLSYQS